MRAVTVDSSVFLSAFIENEEDRLTSLLFLKNLKKHNIKVVIPTLVVAEVINGLARLGSSNLELVRRFFSGFIRVGLTDEFIEQAKQYWAKLGLKTADAIVVVTSVLYDTTLVSLDRQLFRRARKVVEAVTPTVYVKSTRG